MSTKEMSLRKFHSWLNEEKPLPKLSERIGKWRPISSAPKDGTWVLLTGGQQWGEEPCGPCVVAFFDKSDGEWTFAWWDSAWRGAYENATHWQPLPSLPK